MAETFGADCGCAVCGARSSPGPQSNLLPVLLRHFRCDVCHLPNRLNPVGCVFLQRRSVHFLVRMPTITSWTSGPSAQAHGIERGFHLPTQTTQGLEGSSMGQQEGSPPRQRRDDREGDGAGVTE